MPKFIKFLDLFKKKIPIFDHKKELINTSVLSDSSLPITSIPQLPPATLSYASSYTTDMGPGVLGYSSTLKGRTSFIPPEYQLSEVGTIEDCESLLSLSFKKKHSLMFKEGYSFIGQNNKILDYYNQRLGEIAQASNIPTSELLRRIASSLIRTSNAFLVKVRKKKYSSGSIRKDAHGKKLEPVAAYFLAAPETMSVQLNWKGEIVAWKQQISQTGNVRLFEPENVIHFHINRREGFLFGVPTVIPVIDDIRTLRKIEENVELLLYQNIFPLFHYIVGTEKAPAGITEDGEREIDKAKREIQIMPSEGGIITTERHKIELIGSQGKALEVHSYLEYFKRRVISGLGISTLDVGEADCYDEKTETLTENGWKSYKQIDHLKEKIATYNPETNKIEFHIANYKFAEQVNGDLIKFKSKHIDIAVTPNHKMWVCPIDSVKKPERKPNWHLVTAYELLQGKYKNFYIQESADFKENDISLQTFHLDAAKALRGNKVKPIDCNLEDFAKFLGYFVSEGSLDTYNGDHKSYRSLLSQNSGQTLDSMKDTLDKMNMNYSVYFKQQDTEKCATIVIRGKTLYKYLEEFVGCGAHNKKLPQEVFSWPKPIRQSLFDALVDGDGTRSKKTYENKTYYTVSKQLADDVQILALSLGYRAKVLFTKQNINAHGDWIYRVSIGIGGIHHRGFHQVNTSMISKEYYEGVVYCYNVPNHLFVTRRNGKVTIQGNTSNRASGQTLSRALIDSVKDIQATFEAQWNKEIIQELLLESPFREKVLDERNKIILQFREIDIDSKIKQEEHHVMLFEKNAITYTELRNAIGRDPIILPDDPHDQDMKKYPNWRQTKWKLIEEPLALIRAADEPFSPMSQALAEAQGSAIVPTQVQAGVKSQQALQQQKTTIKNFIFESYIDLENEICNRIENNSNISSIKLAIGVWSSHIKNKMGISYRTFFTNGFNNSSGGKSYLFSNIISHGKYEVSNRINRLLVHFTNNLISTLEQNIKDDLSTTVIHSVFDNFLYRIKLIEKEEEKKAYNYGKLLGMKAMGQKYITFFGADICDQCKEYCNNSYNINIFTIDNIVPHHPNCNCDFKYIISKDT